MIQHLRWKPICAFLIRERNQIWRQIQAHSHSWKPIRLVERMWDQQVDRMCNGLLVESKVYLCMWQSFRLLKFLIWIIFKGSSDQAVLFLKSMSKRGGSDIQRLRNWISRSTQNQLKMAGSLVRVVQCRIRLFPTLISKIKRFGLNNP